MVRVLASVSVDYISVVTRLCHNNVRIQALVRRQNIIQVLDQFWARAHVSRMMKNSRAALMQALQLPVSPAPAEVVHL
jgi:hypothetical protein